MGSIPEYLANVALRSLGLAVAAGIALWLLRVKSAAARHAVWTLVTTAMLLMAAVEPWLPAVPLRVLRAEPPVAWPAPMADPPVAPTTVAYTRPAVEMEATPAPPRELLAMPAPAPVRKPITWQQVAAAIYAGGVLAFLALMVSSYRFTRRLVRASREVERPDFLDVRESTWIAVPVTVGFRRPRILLPAGWREWPAEKLDAVMTHERMHVRRADWAIAVLAGINRCVFWFHPLAWWLERQLPALAEQAADDAALLALGARIGYAQTLLDMAAAVRSDRGRMVWEAMAMAKTAEVRTRIERILDETRQIPRGLSRARWAALAACSVPLVYMATAVQLAPAQTAPAAQVASPPQDAVKPVPGERSNLPTSGVVFGASVAVPALAAPAVDTPQAQAQTQPVPKFVDTVSASSQAPYPYRYLAQSANMQLLQKIDPVYPAQAMAAGVEGDVQLWVTIGIDGRVKRAQPIDGNAILAAAAKAAVEQWIYTPKTMGNGEPMEVETTVRIPFRLHPDSPAQPLPTMALAQFAAPQESRPVANTPPAGFSMPILLYKKEPEYSVLARAAGIQGTVILSYTVDVKGHATNIQVTQSLDRLLDLNAVAAVSQWKFQPARQNGVPVESASSSEVTFRLLDPIPPAQAVASQPFHSMVLGSVPSTGNMLPVLISRVEPEYSEQARRAKLEGGVTLAVLVGADGQIHEVQVSHSLGMGLDERATESVKKWRFRPAYQNGQPIDYWTSVVVSFHLL